MSCLKEERKPMVPLKTLDILFRRRYVPNTQHYFTDRKHAISTDLTRTKPSKPYRVPRSEKLLSYIKYSDRKEKYTAKCSLSKPLHLKDNIKIAFTRDISKRLFVEEPTDDVRAVVKIHPEFYTVIEGRPLRCFDDIKVYINNIRNYAMNRQQIGYRRDLILKVEKDLVEESAEHDKINAELKQHIKNVQKFLTEDYNRACVKVNRAEKIYADLVSKNSEFLGYVSNLTILNNVIFKLDAIRSILKMYRRFLLYVAPLPWRYQYDEQLKNSQQLLLHSSDIFTTDDEQVDTLDIDKIVDVARQDLKNAHPAHIYFKRPQQIIYLFRIMEIQSREYLIQHSKTDVPFRRLQERIKYLKLITRKEIDYFDYYIDNIQKEIQREIYNENYLKEKFFRILNTTFYDSIASPSSLKLKICVEYVYEQVFGKNEEGHQSLKDPMKLLEVMYEDYNLRLDSLDFKIVNQARSDFFSQDLKTMANAYKAERELKAFREMTNAMNKAFLPPAVYQRPMITNFLSQKSKRALSKINKVESRQLTRSKKAKLSKEEKDDLLLFTDWCEGSNPEQYLAEYYQYVKSTFARVPKNRL